MADAKPGAPQNLIYSMILEQAKNTAENNLLLRAILEELQELTGLIAQAPSSATPEPIPNAPSSSGDVPAPTATGMEGFLEKMIAEQMGVTPEMIRSGKIEPSAVLSFLNSKATPSTPPTT